MNTPKTPNYIRLYYNDYLLASALCSVGIHFVLTRSVVLWACRCPALGYVVPHAAAAATWGTCLSFYCCRCAPRSGELILYYIVVFFYFFLFWPSRLSIRFRVDGANGSSSSSSSRSVWPVSWNWLSQSTRSAVLVVVISFAVWASEHMYSIECSLCVSAFVYVFCICLNDTKFNQLPTVILVW